MPASKKQRVNFNLHAPEAKQVFVTGTFNDWNPDARPLRCDKKGIWRTWMNLAPGQYEYRFVVDEKWQEDPGCEDRSNNPFGSFNSLFKI